MIGPESVLDINCKSFQQFTIYHLQFHNLKLPLQAYKYYDYDL
jgi:hypothetical protein